LKLKLKLKVEVGGLVRRPPRGEGDRRRRKGGKEGRGEGKKRPVSHTTESGA
jgi:hypothetical protein